MNILIDCHGATDIGRIRSTNEDHFLVADLAKSMRVQATSAGLDHRTRLFGASRGKLLVVADGLGGHESGERASEMVIDTIAQFSLNVLQWQTPQDEPEGDRIQAMLEEAILTCQRRIEHEVEITPQSLGMGTTATLAYIAWPHLFVTHVGDSRCYLFRDGELRQLTRDHTMAQLQEETGEELTATGKTSPENVLWNVVGGTHAELRPETHRGDLRPGDKLLLCTDGLTRHVSDERIATTLGSYSDSHQIVGKLIDEANGAGGRDNITALVAVFRDGHDDGSSGDLTNLEGTTTVLMP